MFENPNPTDAVGLDKHSEFELFFSAVVLTHVSHVFYV